MSVMKYEQKSCRNHTMPAMIEKSFELQAGVNGFNSKQNKEKYKIHLYWRFTPVYLCCIKETPRRALSELYPSAYRNALKNQAQLMGTYVNPKDANK